MTDTPHPPVVTRTEWLAERKKLLEREKELTKHYDQVNAMRRRLPMVKLEKSYAFDVAATSVLQWRALIEDGYQLFEIGSVRLELHSPAGELVDKCENSYVVNGAGDSLADCMIKLKKLDPAQRTGVWTLKTYRGKQLIDVRNIYFYQKDRTTTFKKRRSSPTLGTSEGEIR